MKALTNNLVYCALVDKVLIQCIIAHRHHAANETQTIPHLGPLVSTATTPMETVAMATIVSCK